MGTAQFDACHSQWRIVLLLVTRRLELAARPCKSLQDRDQVPGRATLRPG